MTPLRARLATLTTRRFAAAAALVTLAGGAAGGTAFAAMSGSGATPAQALAATTSATPAPAARTPGRAGRLAGRLLVRGLIRATAKETGLSLHTIRGALRAGQTLDQISGSEAGAVADDALAAIHARLDAAVSAGTITKAQEAARLAKAPSRIQAVMSTALHQASST